MAPKRKRAATLTKDTESTIQPSSRDASGEDAADPTLEEVKERKSLDPPAKRTRASSKASASTANGVVAATAEGPSMNGTVKEAGEHGEAGHMRMAPPPKAGLVDPQGGYKTNKPPEGRPVRIYADGVFDLFHLGYVFDMRMDRGLLLTAKIGTCAFCSRRRLRSRMYTSLSVLLAMPRRTSARVSLCSPALSEQSQSGIVDGSTRSSRTARG